MKDKNHTPHDSIRAAQLKVLGIPCHSLNDPRPAFPVFNCNKRFGPSANDEQYRPSRA